MNKRINNAKKGVKPNKAKALSCLMALLLLLSLYGCSKQETGSAVTSSNVIAEVDIPEEDGLAEGEALDREDVESIGEGSTTGSILPEGLEDIPNSSDVEVPEGEEIVEGTTLTESELEALRSETGYTMEIAEDRYKQITEGGGIKYDDGTSVTEAVGSPYDTSWRQMTDAEAQAILNGEAEGNKAAAEAELLNGAWRSTNGDKMYFDYYQWLADVKSDMQSDENAYWSTPADIVEF